MSRREYSIRPHLGALGLLAILAGSALISGCGKQGVLEQPPPLFGSHARADYEATRAAEAAAAQKRTTSQNADGSAEQTQGEDSPPTKRSIQDPAQKLTPASRAPVAGAPNPFGAPVSTTPGN